MTSEELPPQNSGIEPNLEEHPDTQSISDPHSQPDTTDAGLEVGGCMRSRLSQYSQDFGLSVEPADASVREVARGSAVIWGLAVVCP